VFVPGQQASHLTYLGLHALQHRGQESAGMAVSDGETVTVLKDMGLVSNVFNDRALACLPGYLAIGHVRYSTTGSSTWRNAQPVYRHIGGVPFALGHNGNLVNTEELAEQAGMLVGTIASDSDLLAELLEAQLKKSRRPDDDQAELDLVAALCAVLPRVKGAFSLVLADQHRIIGVRDPNGFRPLCLGKFEANGETAGWVIASESPALDVVGARFVRDIEPGEMVVIDGLGPPRPHPEPIFPAHAIDPRLCLFEFVYFSRPDTMLYGQSVDRARREMGAALARMAPIPPDTVTPARPVLVMPVPDSGIPAAQGYARASGHPYGDGLVKNRYIGRTFIAPSQELRARAVQMKLNPLRENIRGTRLVVIDDSIVRGTTTRAIVGMLREAGAAEVHLRISSPPYKWPCFYGMDTGEPSELIASGRSVEEVRAYVGADTLAYIDLESLIQATGAPQAGFCTACLSNEYPVTISRKADSRVLETLDAHL
jgi:amidophosphoribosyltransferase